MPWTWLSFLHSSKDKVYQVKMKLFSVVSLVALVGCGGTTTEDLGNTETVFHGSSTGYSSEISDWFDIEVGLYNQIQNSVEKSSIRITFDINQNAIFDDGDIRIIAGNATDFTQILGSWAYNSDYIVELNNGGSPVILREPKGIIIRDSETQYVSNLGGVKTDIEKVNGNVTQQSLILRTNRNISGSTPEVMQFVQQARLIDANTPINIELTDGLSDASSDYVPERNLFTQQPVLSLKDPQHDYVGNSSWVDIKSVNFTSSRIE